MTLVVAVSRFVSGISIKRHGFQLSFLIPSGLVVENIVDDGGTVVVSGSRM